MPGRDTAKDMTIRDLRARLARVEGERDRLGQHLGLAHGTLAEIRRLITEELWPGGRALALEILSALDAQEAREAPMSPTGDTEQR